MRNCLKNSGDAVWVIYELNQLKGIYAENDPATISENKTK